MKQNNHNFQTNKLASKIFSFVSFVALIFSLINLPAGIVSAQNTTIEKKLTTNEKETPSKIDLLKLINEDCIKNFSCNDVPLSQPTKVLPQPEPISKPEVEESQPSAADNLVNKNNVAAKAVVKQPAPIKKVAPRINAPFPISFKRVGGQFVCAKKNDHPSKSNKNKKGHMDMECCLDPDEVPNPHCTYSRAKYGKYLK